VIIRSSRVTISRHSITGNAIQVNAINVILEVDRVTRTISKTTDEELKVINRNVSTILGMKTDSPDGT
jgi:hypothetical protein